MSEITTIISFSGGRTSAYMAYKIKTEITDLKTAYVFANTGKEREETLIFVNECDKRWSLGIVWIESVINPQKGVGVGYKIVNFETAARNGEPFSDMVSKFGIPNKEFPHCTRELKERPMQKWAMDNFGNDYVFAIGMRADERKRASARPKRVYPLINTWPTSEPMVRLFWKKQLFDLGLKDYEGNCDLCWKKSLRKRLAIINENPDVIKQWKEWEDSGEFVFDRNGFTMDEIAGLAKAKFRPVMDKMEVIDMAPFLFDVDMDLESKCSCY